MRPHVREARVQGEPSSLKRFLGNAMLAIALFESQSLRNRGVEDQRDREPGPDDDERHQRRAYDRQRASKLVKEARVTLLAFQQALQHIVEWRQLDRYLESLFVADRQQKRRQHDEREGKRPDTKLSARALLRRRKLADLYRGQFRARSPEKLRQWLQFLEPPLALAQEKLKFGPGDFQRNKIVQGFADAMVFAWMSATDAIPTISKSKRPSAFQQLLATINRNILEPKIRHRTDFGSPAVVAVDRARKRYMGKNPRP